IIRNDYVAVKVCDGHFCSRNQVQVVFVYKIHLPFLVGQLAGTIPGCFIHHNGRLDLFVTILFRLIEEEVDQCTLEFSSFAFVNGEARAGDFDTQIEIDDVVFLYQLPMWKGGSSQLRHAPVLMNGNVVITSCASRYLFVWDVRYPVEELRLLVIESGKIRFEIL